MIRDKNGMYRESVPDKTKKGGRRWISSKDRKTVLRKVREWYETEQPVDGIRTERVANEWWETIEPAIAPTTAKGYKPSVRRAVLYLPDRITEITPSDVSAAISRYISAYRPARKSATTLLQVIRQICQFAVERNYIRINPAAGMKVPKGLEKKKVTMPSKGDIEIVKNNSDSFFGRFLFFALYTGMRRGELVALRYEDIDRQARTISVNKSAYYVSVKPNLKSTKTEAGCRTIPIVDKLLPIIGDKKTGLVFGRPSDGRMLTNDDLNHFMDRYRAETGYTGTIHQLRHAFATMLFEAGIEAKDAQKWLGHAQYSTTMDIYTDIREEREKAVTEIVKKIDL